jgi:1-acyl-sn-glycerol-3-phosphate acyltransferase
MVLAGSLMRPVQRRRFARATISRAFRLQFAIASAAGLLRLDLSELDALKTGPAVVIAPNHPSIIDAALLLSRLPDLTCVMKAQILANPLFGCGARMACYITNDPPRSMLRAATEHLQAGHHLLLFPEGTRTQQLPVNPLQRTVAVIAKRAQAPVQTVHIESSSPVLCKGWPLWRTPALPMVYRARLGRRFEPPVDVDAFTAELEAYFRSELAGAHLPSLPVDAQSR